MFLKLNFQSHPTNINCHVTLNKYPTDTMGTLYKYNLHNCQIEGKNQTPSLGIEPATLRSTMHRATLLVLFFRLFGALVKWLSSRTYVLVPRPYSGSLLWCLEWSRLHTPCTSYPSEHQCPTAWVTARRYRACLPLIFYIMYATKLSLITFHLLSSCYISHM